MRSISCDASRLYAQGGRYEGSPCLDGERAGRWIANVYAPYAYQRPLPQHVLSKDDTTPARLSAQYGAFNTSFPRGASTDLFAIENAILYDRSLYVVVPPGELAIVYETNRPVDRPWRKDLDPALLSNARRPAGADRDYVYFSSVGSENYGHWLIDDLTRYKGIVEHLGDSRGIGIVLEQYGDPIDAIRKESLLGCTPQGVDIDFVFIEPKTPYFFGALHYVTPSSYAPVLKAPEGVAFLRSRIAKESRPVLGSRLFVNRAAVWRSLLNAEEVSAFFAGLSFTVVCPDTEPMTLAEQVRIFAGASVVVGVAGAAMTSTLFCPPGARLFYLAGEGFSDPWYWDLAAVSGHEYSVCFGTPWKPKRPNFSSFTIDREQLQSIRNLL